MHFLGSSPAVVVELKDGAIKPAAGGGFRYFISLTMKTAIVPLEHIDDYSNFKSVN